MNEISIIQKLKQFTDQNGPSLLNLLIDAEKLYLHLLALELSKISSWNVTPLELRTMTQICLEGSKNSSLAKRLNLSRQAISQVLNSLEEQKLIVRKTDDKDKRQKLVYFTKKGHSFIVKAIEAGIHVELKIKANLAQKSNLSDLKKGLVEFIHKRPQLLNEAVQD